MNKKILLVDDDANILILLKEFLSELGFEVFAFEDPKLALSETDFSKIDCVVTDIRMPDIDGVQLVTLIHKKGYTPTLFFITGYSDYPREVLNQFSPKAIIFKPFDLEEASLLIKSYLN